MRVFTIQQLLQWIVGTLVLCVLILGVGLSCHAYFEGRQLAREQAAQAARALLRAVDAEFQAATILGNALATSPAVRERAWPVLYAQAQTALRHSHAGRLVLTTVDGQPVLDTLLPFGSRLPPQPALDWPAQVAACGQPTVSDLDQHSAGLGQQVQVCVPVRLDGRMAYLLTVSLTATQFAQQVTAAGLPPAWIVSVSDRRGAIAVRRQGAAPFVNQAAEATPQPSFAADAGDSAGTVMQEGIAVYRSVSRSASSGWGVEIGVPAAAIRPLFWRPLGISVAASLLLLAAGLALASYLGRTLRNTVSNLVAMSAGLAGGESVAGRPTRLLELGELGAALSQSSAALRVNAQGRTKAEALLRHANAALAQQVAESETELRQSRQLLATVVEYMPAMVFLKRADDLRYIMLNRAGELLLGIPREQVIERTDVELLGAEQALVRTAHTQQALHSAQVIEIDQERLRLPSGDTRYLRTRRIALRGADGEPTHLLGISWDVTDTKLADDQLRIAAVAFESQEAMLITDQHNLIVRVNQAFTASSGYHPAEVLGRSPQMFNSGRHDEDFYETMWQTIHRFGAWKGELWERRKNTEVYPTWTTISAIRDASGQITNYVCAQTDISASKQAEEDIRQLAFYDPLTHLPNRRLLRDRLHHAIEGAARSGRFSALMFIDLDNFKLLNDTLGHDQGDQLLRLVAERLPPCVRAGDTVARLGGDEFVIMLEELGASDQEAALRAQVVGQNILDELNRPYLLAGRSCRCSPSIGITVFSDHDIGVDELLKRADLAMYQAKAEGRNTLRFFEPHMQTVVNTLAETDHALHEALSHNQFELYYQAQVDHHGEVTGAEALLRWNHPQRGLVEPDQFIQQAEQSGFILPLGLWVLRQACSQLAAWALLPNMLQLKLAINVSSRQFLQHDFVEQVFSIIEHSGVEPSRLKFELTETLLLSDFFDVTNKMLALKQRGIGLSLDDFGTGYSSLTYLKQLPLDQLKIDRSFSRDVLSDPNDAAIARVIVALGNTLDMSIIAEGVETEDQRAFLAQNDCHFYQGYLFSRPLPEQGFRDYVAQTQVARI